MEQLIALQNNLGLGHLGDVIITTQGRMDENKPCIATLTGDEVGAALSLIERWNEYDTLKAKAEALDEAVMLLTNLKGCVRYESQMHDNIGFFLSKAKEL